MSKKPFFKKRTFFNKKQIVKKIGVVAVHSSSNNTIIQVRTSDQTNFCVSAGLAGLKGAKRSTVYAAQQTVNLLSQKLKEKKIEGIFLFFRGFGRGRKSILKTLKKNKIKILQIFDRTGISHNGCRPKKKRRL